jgi:hypothetical protein
MVGRPQRLRPFEPTGELAGIVDQDWEVLRADMELPAAELHVEERDVVRPTIASYACM